MSTTAEPASTTATPIRRWRPPVALLAVGTFTVGTDAFVIAGVLPDIARSLQVGIGAAGQLVTVFSIAYAVLAPLLGTLTASWSRRHTLVIALVILAAGNAVTALAPGYLPVLASRVIAAGGAALYTANASATASLLAGEKQRGRAIALVMLGLTSSLVLGAPLGTAIGTALGWRATMWSIAAMALLLAPFIALFLPHTRQGAKAGLRHRLTPLADRRVLGVLATTVVVFTGIYIPYTYLSAIYAPTTASGENRLAALLLAYGIAGTIGNLTAGHAADRVGPRRVIIAGILLLTVVFTLVPLLREPFTAALIAVALSGFFSFTVTTPQQQQIIALAPGTQALVTSLYQSALYLAISLSGVVGAAGLNAIGPLYLSLLAALLVFIAAVMAWRLGRFLPGVK